MSKEGQVKKKREYIKWDIDKVRKYVQENTESVVVSDSYVRSRDKLIFKCKCNRTYTTSWNTFLQDKKHQCDVCSGANKWTHETVEKYIGEQGTCKLLSKYKGLQENMLLLCECGEEFTTTFDKVLYRKKHRCNKCNKMTDYTYKSVKEYIENNSDCTLLSQKYKNQNTELDMVCGCGRFFKSSFGSFKHANKRKCEICSGYTTWNYEKVRKYIEDNTNCILLSKKYSGVEKPLHLICECGNTFKRSLHHLTYRSHYYCDECGRKGSKAERVIKSCLESLNINFKSEYTFDNLKSENGKLLRFDFVVFDNSKNIYKIFEYDGEGHFRPVNFGGMSDKSAKKSYEKTVHYDSLKNSYCKDNGLDLIRIPYWDFNNIENIIKENLKDLL